MTVTGIGLGAPFADAASTATRVDAATSEHSEARPLIRATVAEPVNASGTRPEIPGAVEVQSGLHPLSPSRRRSMIEAHEGGCACGEVRYRLRSDPLFVHCCHCLNCQRQTGSAFVINLLIETDRVELLDGDPQPVAVARSGGKSRRSGAARPARSRSTASTPAPGCGSFAAGRSTTRRRSRPTFTSTRGRSCPG